jgi:predicted PurR-regulated permease PerM
MNSSNQTSSDNSFMTKALEVTINLGLVVLLLLWCFKIVRPFVEVIVWGIIIAVAVYPFYNRLKSALGGRDGLSATLLTLLALIVLIVPAFLLSESLIDTVQDISSRLENGTLSIPPPSENVRAWPVIGEPLYNSWNLASENLGAALRKLTPDIKQMGGKLLSVVANTGAGILMFVISIIIAGVLLANSARNNQAARALAERLAGERGAWLIELEAATVRSVAQGIIGVALIQAILAGLGCLVVGVPGAGFWALLVLILSIVQLPALLVLGPIIIYVFSAYSTVTAVVFAIWSFLVAISDSFLKPLLMGRGVDVPMLVIFIGAIGGFMASGIIGLFVGAIILVLGYKLFLEWLNPNKRTEPVASSSE